MSQVAASALAILIPQQATTRQTGCFVLRVTPDMYISEVLAECPQAVEVFERHGLACAACLAASMEPLSAVASVHDVSIDALIDELNRNVESGDCTS